MIKSVDQANRPQEVTQTTKSGNLYQILAAVKSIGSYDEERDLGLHNSETHTLTPTELCPKTVYNLNREQITEFFNFV